MAKQAKSSLLLLLSYLPQFSYNLGHVGMKQHALYLLTLYLELRTQLNKHNPGQTVEQTVMLDLRLLINGCVCSTEQ